MKGVGEGILLFVARELYEGKLTHSVIGAYYEVYNHLGFGLLERFYVTALERELLERGHRVAREVSVNVLYKGQELGSQRLDNYITISEQPISSSVSFSISVQSQSSIALSAATKAKIRSIRYHQEHPYSPSVLDVGSPGILLREPA